MRTRSIMARMFVSMGVLAVLMLGLGTPTATGTPPAPPPFDPNNVEPGAPITNPFFPLTPGTLYVYEGEKEEVVVEAGAGEETVLEHVEVLVTYRTKKVMDLPCVVVRDLVWEDDLLMEETDDWFLQDKNGNVWYMGEWSTEYEYDDDDNLIGENHDGSWQAGVGGALPGYVMEANPLVGDNYYQEYYAGEAEDEATVVSLDASVSVKYGDFDDCLQTFETTALEPDVLEYKYYAAGVGLVLVEELAAGPGASERGPDGGPNNLYEVEFTSELIRVEHVPAVIPEPAGLSVLLLGGLSLTRRRRRRR